MSIQKNYYNTAVTIILILFIGLFQILSLVPGVSRAGITITAARILKFNRVDSSKISFLLSIPALSGASILGLKDSITNKKNNSGKIMLEYKNVDQFEFLTKLLKTK